MNKTFAVAYRIFKDLDNRPVKSKEYAKRFSLSRNCIKAVVKTLSQMGCIATKRGGSVGGISKLPGFTVTDLFERFKVPYQEGEQFEKQIDSLLAKSFSKMRVCTVCDSTHKEEGMPSLCRDCFGLGEPLLATNRLAKCGHYSATRYFHCEECKPELEDNTTPEDFGCVLSL